MGVEFKREQNNHIYKFGTGHQYALGLITIRIPILENMAISERIDVIKANVSFLLNFGLIEKYKWQLITFGMS